MAEITWGGLWIKWSSLSKRDKRSLVITVALSGLTGGLAGGVDDLVVGPADALSLIDMLWIAAPLVCLLGVFWLLARFSARQDELYRTLESLALKVAAVIAFFVLFAAMVIDEALGIWLLKSDGTFMVCILAYAIGWFVATRRLL